MLSHLTRVKKESTHVAKSKNRPLWTMAHLSVKELKGDLIAAGVDLSSYVEKSEPRMGATLWDRVDLLVVTEDVPSAEPTVAVAVAAPHGRGSFGMLASIRATPPPRPRVSYQRNLIERVHPKFLHSNATSHTASAQSPSCSTIQSTRYPTGAHSWQLTSSPMVKADT